MFRWQLQSAKNRLSEVVRDAIAKGPQIITLHGQDAVVVLAMARYRALTGEGPSLVDCLRRAADLDEGEDLVFDRATDDGRRIEL